MTWHDYINAYDTVCQECGHPFTPDEWEDRHSGDYGDDVHAECCTAPDCCEKPLDGAPSGWTTEDWQEFTRNVREAARRQSPPDRCDKSRGIRLLSERVCRVIVRVMTHTRREVSTYGRW